MSIINLKLEKIKDEDYDKEFTEENIDIATPSITECGKVFLDLEMNTVSFSCFFCEATFQDVHDLIDHVKYTHIIESDESEELFELDCSINGNSLEITPVYCPNETEESNDEMEISINRSTDTITSISTNALYECDIYGKTFHSKLKNQVHPAIHTDELEFHCELCSSVFPTEKMLSYHSAIHSGGDNDFKCNHCDQIFTKKRYLITHLKYHLGDENAFPCTVCGKPNRTAHQLKIHMVKHSSNKDHICEICGVSYGLRHHLTTHQRQKHENKREFKCNKCDRAFNTITFLNSHKLSHSKERKHICTICGSGFVWRKNLVEHIKLHSDTKSYKCELCGKTFAQKSGLTTHKKGHLNFELENEKTY